MRSIKTYAITGLLFLSGCGRINISKEFASINKRVERATGHTVTLRKAPSMTCEKTVAEQVALGISRDQAIGIALINNPELQAHFETLGVAKANLVQAGLYTNPDVHAFFWPPLQKKTDTEMEIGAFFKISDLWQVPLRKEVAHDVLEMVTNKILELVLDTIKETRMAYDNVLFAHQQLLIFKEIEQQSIKLRAVISDRQNFGLSSDLDNYVTQVTSSKARLEVIHAQKNLSHAYLELKKILGIEPTPTPIKLTDAFEGIIEQATQSLPMLEQLQAWALDHRPEILSARMKVKQLKDTVALENARVLNTVNAGISFKQDFDGSRGFGPNVELSLPLFDQNQAQRARAEFLLAQAEKELIATKQTVQRDVQQHYLDFMSAGKELKIYENELLPANKKALAYTDTYEKIMQVTMITLVQTKTALYQNKFAAVETYYHALNALSKLERAVGRRIDLTL